MLSVSQIISYFSASVCVCLCVWAGNWMFVGFNLTSIDQRTLIIVLLIAFNLWTCIKCNISYFVLKHLLNDLLIHLQANIKPAQNWNTNWNLWRLLIKYYFDILFLLNNLMCCFQLSIIVYSLHCLTRLPCLNQCKSSEHLLFSLVPGRSLCSDGHFSGLPEYIWYYNLEMHPKTLNAYYFLKCTYYAIIRLQNLTLKAYHWITDLTSSQQALFVNL